MPEQTAVDAAVLAALRAICLALPEVEEQEAWVGTRWRIRTKTFAHVVAIDAGWPPAYVRRAASRGVRRDCR